MKLRTLAVAVAAALLATMFLGPYAAAHSGVGARPLSGIPISGTFGDGGTFTGTFDIKGFTKKSGQLLAVGTIDGTLTFPGGDTRSLEDVKARVPVTSVSASRHSPDAAASAPEAQPAPQQAPGSCLVHLEFGGITLDVAGIQLSISAFTLDLTLTGLLGQILCGLLGVLGGAPPQAQTQLLNQALGASR